MPRHAQITAQERKIRAVVAKKLGCEVSAVDDILGDKKKLSGAKLARFVEVNTKVREKYPHTPARSHPQERFASRFGIEPLKQRRTRPKHKPLQRGRPRDITVNRGLELYREFSTKHSKEFSNQQERMRYFWRKVAYPRLIPGWKPGGQFTREETNLRKAFYSRFRLGKK
jgi:hypothetical protein